MRLFQRHGKLNVELQLEKAAAAALSDVRIDDAVLLRSASPDVVEREFSAVDSNLVIDMTDLVMAGV
jgi:hypothetical protein